jgi:hypothetical protein
MRYVRPGAFALLALLLGGPAPASADVPGTWQGRLKCLDLRNGNGDGDPIFSFTTDVTLVFTQNDSDGCCHTNGNVTLDDSAGQLCGLTHAYSSLTTNAQDGMLFFTATSGEATCTGIATLSKDKKLELTYTDVFTSSGHHNICEGKLKRAN